MPRNGSNVYSLPAGSLAVSGTTIESAPYNSVLNDLVSDLNLARPIVAGGTGASTASAARTALGLEIGSDVQAYSAILLNTTASFTTADETKLDGIETGATADQTASEIAAMSQDWRGEGAETLITATGALQTAIENVPDWTLSAISTATGGSEIDFTGIPTSATEIELIGRGMSLSNSADFLVQLGVGGSPVTSGYDATGEYSTSSNNQVGANSSAGALIQNFSASGAQNFRVTCVKFPGINTWIISHQANLGTSLYMGNGMATVALAGSVNMLRLTATSAATFDANQSFIRYR